MTGRDYTQYLLATRYCSSISKLEAIGRDVAKVNAMLYQLSQSSKPSLKNLFIWQTTLTGVTSAVAFR